MSPEISVVIPVRNEALKIRKCIEGILSQTVAVGEIIVIDSGSTDGTLEILREYPVVRVIEINPSEFNHGETRNVGVRAARGEFVVLTVGDAIPYNERWIECLLDGFDSADVAGVCGQQVVSHEPGNNPLHWYRPIDAPSKTKYHFPDGKFQELAPAEKLKACGWDDVTAMYRRSVLLEIPFQFTSFAEDAIWAKEALSAGYAIVYNAAARVYHHHHENRDFVFKRTLTTIYMRYKHFGYVYPRNGQKTNVRQELSNLKQILMAPQMKFSQKLRWWKHNRQYGFGVKDAHDSFHHALSISEEELDRIHSLYCGKPPIPIKSHLK